MLTFSMVMSPAMADRMRSWWSALMPEFKSVCSASIDSGSLRRSSKSIKAAYQARRRSTYVAHTSTPTAEASRLPHVTCGDHEEARFSQKEFPKCSVVKIINKDHRSLHKPRSQSPKAHPGFSICSNILSQAQAVFMKHLVRLSTF